MGEYIKCDGEQVKLGTCEDLYYTRLDQLKAPHTWEALGGNDDHAGYLNPSNGFRYRFPFPDEDDVKIGDFEPYDRGLLVELSEKGISLVSGMDHGTITLACRPEAQTEQTTNLRFQIVVPCLHGSEFEIIKPFTHSNNRNSRAIEIVRQKQVDGEVWVIVRCPWCGCMSRLPIEDAVQLADEVRHQVCYHAPSFWNAVADRIMAGYKVPVET